MLAFWYSEQGNLVTSEGRYPSQETTWTTLIEMHPADQPIGLVGAGSRVMTHRSATRSAGVPPATMPTTIHASQSDSAETANSPSEPLRPRRRQARTEDDQTAPRQRYSERFRRQERYQDEEADDRSYRSTRDPYDRLRRVSNRPARRVEPEYDTEDEYDQFDGPDFEPAPRTRSARRPARNQPPRIDQQRIREVGALIANPRARTAAAGIGFSRRHWFADTAFDLDPGSVRSDGSWIPLHLDAEGIRDVVRHQGRPLAIAVLRACGDGHGLGTRLVAAGRDSYAVQYLTVGALMIHCLVWVGLSISCGRASYLAAGTPVAGRGAWLI